MTLTVAPPLSLYVHFPWCVRKCPYCDFNSYTLRNELPEDRYLEALERDLESQADGVRGRPIISVFFGGGTPSLFSSDAIGRVLTMARRHLTFADDVEITLEANPGTIERGRFTGYREVGVNRISLGAQSFDARRLVALGRIHTPQETERAAEELHAAGLDNFNLDLMYALPGQTTDEALKDIEIALALRPAHISHYQLTIEPGTAFAAQPPVLPVDDDAAEMLAQCTARLAEEGFAHYEVSGYAREGRQCRHNLNYWTFGDYLGIGAGAHGKLSFPQDGAIVRTWHPREPRRYTAGVPTAISRKPVTASDLPFEFMMNALRLVRGFDVATFTARTGLPWSVVTSVMTDLAARELVTCDGSQCRTTVRGLRFLNEVLLEFLPESPQSSVSPMLSIGA